MTGPVTTEALDAAATKALAEELLTYANQLVRVETQAGLGGKDLSVRVKEPGWLADLMRRSASALQARRLAAAEASLATATSELARLRAEVEAVLDEATRMSSILLMAGEMTAQERRTARAVALGISLKVRTALASAATAREGA